MWKKEDQTTPTPPISERKEEPGRSVSPPQERPGREVGERASIGRSITIKGEVRGEEDLLIQGRVEGSVDLRQQSVTIGKEGRVKADINARVVTVEGEVEGDVQALEQVILRSSAQVQGDIVAPRVVLEDGAGFKGLVDMRNPFGEDEKGGGGSSSGGKKAGESGATSSEKAGSSSSGSGSSDRTTGGGAPAAASSSGKSGGETGKEGPGSTSSPEKVKP